MDEEVELVTFTSKEAYVYAPLPPATSYGHRAELWNPDKWLKEVKVKVVTTGHHCFVRMLDNESGELFAECPLPSDGTPLTTAVEPVVDSSRYFVVKLVDRDSRKHAFVGIGFRERIDASDFSAALDDYRQYLRRKQAAEQMRQEFSKLEAAGTQDGEPSSGDAAAAAAAAAALDFSLKPGQTIKINLSSSLKRTSSGKSPAGGGSSTSSSGSSTPAQQFVGLKLAPPALAASAAVAAAAGSSSSFFKLQPPPAATSLSSSTASAGSESPAGRFGQQQMGPASNPGTPHAAGGSAGVAAAADGASGGAVEDDDWGDFVS